MHTFVKMKRKNQIQKLILAGMLVLGVQVVFAAFTSTISGRSTKKSVNSQYTLSNISKFSNKGLALGTVRYTSKLKPAEFTSTQAGTVSNSNIELTKGNTTFIYPYKIKVKVPKFKAPEPVGH